MSIRGKAQELVDGFFIGGGGDDLWRPNLTKFDLVNAVERLLADERERCATIVERSCEDYIRSSVACQGKNDSSYGVCYECNVAKDIRSGK